MDLGSRYFDPVTNTSRREVSLAIAITIRIIYEWGTCTCAIRRFRLEIVNIEILQHILVVKYFDCNRYGIGIRDYGYGLIFEIWRILDLTDVMKDIV